MCVCVCVFSLKLSCMQFACAVLYCYLGWLYHIFPRYWINDTISTKKKVLNMNCVFWFSVQVLSETFLILGKIQWDIINVHMLTPILLTWRIQWAPNNASKWRMGFNSAFKGLSTHYSCHILMKPEFSRQIYKILKYKMSWKFVHWEAGFCMRAGGWTDGHHEANSCFSQFFECT